MFDMGKKERKQRSDAGKPRPHSRARGKTGNKGGHGVKGNRGGGRKKGRTLLLKVMSLPEVTADFVRYEQQRRGCADERETVKAILAELALTWDVQRHARLDASLLIL